MRQDFFDFTPTFKLLVAGNHKPRLTSVDEAIRRRLLLVPFTVQIPLAERDKDFADKLKPEWPAILRWMVDGCLEWQRIGLAPPKIVLDATEDYFAEQDTLQQWIDDCTDDGGEFALTRTADLFASWKTWCDARNLKPGSEQGFSSALHDKGFQKKRNAAGQMAFRNLIIRQPTQGKLTQERSNRIVTPQTADDDSAVPTGSIVLGIAAGQRCELCGSGRDVYRIQLPGELEAAPRHKPCATRYWERSKASS
jgi:phage/plasmid-associated DNA primase